MAYIYEEEIKTIGFWQNLNQYKEKVKKTKKEPKSKELDKRIIITNVEELIARMETKLTAFGIHYSQDDNDNGAICSEFDIYMEFGYGKEMCIYVEDGNLVLETD